MKAILKQMKNNFGGAAVSRLMLMYNVKCEPTATAFYNYSIQVCGGVEAVLPLMKVNSGSNQQFVQSSASGGRRVRLTGLRPEALSKARPAARPEARPARHRAQTGICQDPQGRAEERMRLPATGTRFLQPEELSNMLDLGLQQIPRSGAQAVWNIEDIPPSSLTAGWMAWYFGLTPDSSSVLDNATMKRLKLKLHPDSMQNYGRDALAFKSLFQVLGANTGSSAEFAGRLTLQRNAAATTLINNRAQQQFGEAREHREQLQEVCSDALKLVRSQEVQILALKGKLSERSEPSAVVEELRRKVDTQTAKADAFKRKFEMSEIDTPAKGVEKATEKWGLKGFGVWLVVILAIVLAWFIWTSYAGASINARGIYIGNHQLSLQVIHVSVQLFRLGLQR
eukprot:jgi/Astpho2/8014/fgenesh1_pg.00120_%23_10_t